MAPEHGLSQGGESQRLDHGFLLLVCLIADLHHLDFDGGPVLQAPRRPRSDVARSESRPQLQGAKPEPARGGVRLAGDRALRRFHERGSGFLREILGRRALELGEELDGLIEVVGPDLEELLARSLREPLGEARVVLRTCELGETGVRNLADEEVLEAIRGLAGDRRPRLAEYELLLLEVLEQRVDVLDVRREMLQRALPEHPADD